MKVSAFSRVVRFARRQADIVVALGVLLGACSGVIYVFGGKIPPWYTQEQAATDRRAAATINAQTVAALQRLSDRQDQMQRRDDQRDCGSLAADLDKAQAGLRRNPDDPLALALAQSTRSQMREISGCSQ